MAKERVDELDTRILDALTADAREPVAALARRLRVPRSTVQERIDRLERSGVIAGYTVRLGAAATNRAVSAHVSVTVDPKRAESVLQNLRAITEIRRLQTVSGPYDLLAVVAAATTDAVDAVLDRIGAVDGVERTTSAIVLSTKFDR